jgi:glycosyltransferase involved in cell wall biosynthesis
MQRVYIAVINDIVTDQRLHRVAGLLVRHGAEVICFGRRLRDSPLSVNMGCRTRRYRMIFTRGPLFYVFFNARLFLAFLFVRRPALFIANDLDTLPALFLCSRIRRVNLIYDSHELFTQVPELIHRKRVQKIWKWIESILVPKLKYAVTVSYPIAEIYRRLYGVRFKVVRNVPLMLVKPKERQVPGEYLGKRLIIYQGALNMGRGLELMIGTMHFLEKVVFIVVGKGDIEGELRELVKKEGLEGKVQFMGRLLPNQLIPLTSICDLGVSLEEDLGLNYRYSLPNKIFDYIQARIPVLCSALPEMARVIETYGVGVATGERDPEKLAAIIRYMLEERSSHTWIDALDRAALELCWENESRAFTDLFVQCGLLEAQNN